MTSKVPVEQPDSMCQINYRIGVDWRQIHISLVVGLSRKSCVEDGKTPMELDVKLLSKSRGFGDLNLTV